MLSQDSANCLTSLSYKSFLKFVLFGAIVMSRIIFLEIKKKVNSTEVGDQDFGLVVGAVLLLTALIGGYAGFICVNEQRIQNQDALFNSVPQSLQSASFNEEEHLAQLVLGIFDDGELTL